MAIASINPFTGEKVKEFKPHNDVEIEKTLRQAEAAFDKHRREPFPKRAQLMVEVATLLEREKNELGRTITLEMGKLFRDSVAEIEKCANGCRYYSENAERFLEDEAVVAVVDGQRHRVRDVDDEPAVAFWLEPPFGLDELCLGHRGAGHAVSPLGC